MHVRDVLDLLPLRQSVVPAGDAACAFARQGLLAGLSRPGRFQVVGHREGGRILAAGEFALAEAQVLLRQAWRDRISFGAVTVHTYVDTQAGATMVPIMFLRIDAPRSHLKELLAVLEARGAHMKEVDAQRHRAIVRAELEYSRAFDLQREVHRLTDGSAHCLSWLLEYRKEGPRA